MPDPYHQPEQYVSSEHCCSDSILTPDEEDQSSTNFEQLTGVGRSVDDGSTRGSTRSDRLSRRSCRHSSLIPSLAGDPNIGKLFWISRQRRPRVSTRHIVWFGKPKLWCRTFQSHQSTGNLVSSGSAHQQAYPSRSPNPKVTEPMLFHGGGANIGRNVMLSED